MLSIYSLQRYKPEAKFTSPYSKILLQNKGERRVKEGIHKALKWFQF